jgi:tetratricopeptide (TPR) repeat protein
MPTFAATTHTAGRCPALLQYADWLGDVGRYGDAIRSIRRALTLATRHGDTEAQAVGNTMMAITLVLHGQAARAERAARQALALLGRSAPPAARSRALMALGLVHLYQDRPDAAAACFTRVLRVQQAAGSVRGQAEAATALAPCGSGSAATPPPRGC